MRYKLIEKPSYKIPDNIREIPNQEGYPSLTKIRINVEGENVENIWALDYPEDYMLVNVPAAFYPFPVGWGLLINKRDNPTNDISIYRGNSTDQTVIPIIKRVYDNFYKEVEETYGEKSWLDAEGNIDLDKFITHISTNDVKKYVKQLVERGEDILFVENFELHDAWSNFKPKEFKRKENNRIDNWFSNMKPCKIIVDEVEYKSVEHYFQSEKTHDPVRKEEIINAHTAYKAKALGKNVPLRDDWEKVKIYIMYKGLQAKFSQEEWKQKLLECDYPIIEWNNWGDNFWGVLEDGKGRNVLGYLLMMIKHKLESND